jgi:hypothetical protein
MSEIALQLVAAKIASRNMALRYDILLYSVRQDQPNGQKINKTSNVNNIINKFV